MPTESLMISEYASVLWYEKIIPIRGCRLSMEKIKRAYKDLQQINDSFGRQLLSTAAKPDELSDEAWTARKNFLMNDAFRLTVTITGYDDQQIYGENVDVFDDPNLPTSIKSIYFTNRSAFHRNANREPENRVSIFLDFGKPEIFDPSPIVSSRTPNESNAVIKSKDITYYNAVQKSIEEHLTTHKTLHRVIHRNFSYDFGLWFFAAPMSLYFSAYYMNETIAVGSQFEIFRWPLFIYFIGISLIIYRGFSSYARWAFPVNILIENRDQSLKHRATLGIALIWLLYKIADSAYTYIINGNLMQV